MSALFNSSSLLIVVVLLICTSSQLRPRFGQFIDPKKKGFKGVLGKFAVIGDRLSLLTSFMCFTMAFYTVFIR